MMHLVFNGLISSDFCLLFWFHFQDGFVLEAGNDDDAYNAVSDICGELYGESAKCNKYMGNDANYAVSNSAFDYLR